MPQEVSQERLEVALTGHEAEGEAESGGGLKDVMDIAWVSRYSWFDLLVVTAIGCIMGGVAFPYGEAVDLVPDLWLEATGPEGLVSKAENIGFCRGSPWWILISWGCCTLVGLLKAVLQLDAYPSFITELKHQHVDVGVSAKVVVCCIASLCAGATLGLEAGLGAIGAALGVLTARGVERCGPRCLPNASADQDVRRRCYILCGMAGAFGAILPAPFIAAILVAELASAGTERGAAENEFMAGRKLPKKIMVFVFPAATAAFVTRYAIKALPSNPKPFYEIVPYDNWSVFYGILLGVVAAALGLFFVLIGAVIKVPFKIIGSRVEGCCGKAARQVLLASLAGLLSGCGIYMFPLAMGSGKAGISPTIRFADDMSLGLLIGTALAKTVTYWAAASGGLVGGIFYPLLYLGVAWGEVCAKVFNLDPQICVAVMLAALPSAILTAPLTLLAFPVGLFVTGPVQTVPIAMAIVTSNTLLVGTGFLEKLMSKGQRS
eukprot:TRINITY_DN80485_c0_g1_i1.p1 TRINITY_DN80485_c0_g1~~TRINITY_DN80485_c0_g1_i1.p1  ORF type:complete len:501 (-),score=79.56 TRINITY_DN80485_c0_g1_i1:5-1477(-)